MPRPKKHDLYVVKESFHAQVAGEPLFVIKGERVRAGHDLLRLYPDYFEPADTHVQYDVEQATAAPGELRG